MVTDFHEDEGPDPEFAAKGRILGDQITEAARKLGLYTEGIAIKVPMGEDEQDPARLLVFTTFMIGDVAWRPRTIDREQAVFDDKFSAIAEDDDEAEAERLRKLIAEGQFPGLRRDEDQ